MDHPKTYEDIEDLLDHATIEYGKIQEQIDSLLPTKKPSTELPPPGGTNSSKIDLKKWQELKDLQDKVLKKALADAKKYSEQKTKIEAEQIIKIADDWRDSDLGKRYEYLRELKTNPIAVSEKNAKAILKNHENNPTQSWKNFLAKDLKYEGKSNNENQPEKDTANKNLSMSDRFSEKLNYSGLDRRDIGYEKHQQAKSYASNRDEIIVRPEAGGNAETKQVEKEKGD